MGPEWLRSSRSALGTCIKPLLFLEDVVTSRPLIAVLLDPSLQLILTLAENDNDGYA